MLHVEQGDTGNFLNLPYHGGDESFRYAYDDKLNALTVEKFISLVDENKVTPEDFEKLEPKEKEKTRTATRWTSVHRKTYGNKSSHQQKYNNVSCCNLREKKIC